MPQDITATQRSFGNTGGCITAVTWNSPTNLAEDDVQYQVLRNGTDIPEYKGNETLAVYRVCTCSGSHILSVTATNRCGRKVQSSPSVAVTLDQNVTLLRECNAPTSPPTCPQVNSDDKCNGKMLVLCNI